MTIDDVIKADNNYRNIKQDMNEILNIMSLEKFIVIQHGEWQFYHAVYNSVSDEDINRLKKKSPLLKKYYETFWYDGTPNGVYLYSIIIQLDYPITKSMAKTVIKFLKLSKLDEEVIYLACSSDEAYDNYIEYESSLNDY